MRKLVQFIGVFLLFGITLRLSANPVSVQTATTVAKNFWKSNPLTTDLAGDLRYTHLADSNGFTTFYIFEKSDGDGFVIVAADDRVQPILGYSVNGKLDQRMPVNAKSFLQGYEDFILGCVRAQVAATPDIKAEWTRLSDTVSTFVPYTMEKAGFAPIPKLQARAVGIGPLLTTTWNQSPLYNTYCPYDTAHSQLTVTGCVATAMAQVMKYWNYPRTGVGKNAYYCTSHDTLRADFGSTTYDWENMPSSLTASSTSAQLHAVALLSYHCGVAVNMQYDIASTGGSSAYMVGNAPSAEHALKNFFAYKSSLRSVLRASCSDSLWHALLDAELNAARPVLYSGTNNSGGHAFVCDGYDASGYYHFNWGWGGHYDGYFATDALNPQGGGVGGNNSNTYNLNQSMLIGIEPDNSMMKVVPAELDAPCEGVSIRVAVRTADSNSAPWSVSGNQSWIMLSETSGAGSGSISNIIVTTLPNYSNLPRKGMLVFVQGTDTIHFPILQLSENSNASGNYGNEDYTYYYQKDSGDYVVFRPETYGSFSPGDTLVGVYFYNYYYDTVYTSKNFYIRIYENPTYSLDLAEGSAELPSTVLGSLVYTQAYSASAYGLQEVKLTTPYIRSNKPFWIMLECRGKCLILMEQVYYKDTLPSYLYPYQDAISGAYLVGNASSIRASYNASCMDNNCTRFVQYNLNYAFGARMSFTVPPMSLEVNARADEVSHGYVTGSGRFFMDDTVTLAAVANKGYLFSRWQDGDTAAVRGLRISAYSYPEYIAYFTAKSQYNLSLMPSSITMGYVVGSGHYYEGDTAVAAAVPAPNHQFVRWSDAVTDNPRYIPMKQNVALTAVFVALDTAYVHDTTVVYDTLYVNRYIHDTTILHDTTKLYVHDTTVIYDTTYLYRYIHDTTLIHDTTNMYYYVHDTTLIHDTSYIYRYVHDTTILIDTSYIYQYVHDTTTLYDTTYVNHYIYDTLQVYDTVYLNHYDTVWKEAPHYVFNIRSDNEQYGTTVGSGTYAENTMIGIAALAKENYRFVRWSDGSTENPRHIQVTANVELTASFEMKDGVPGIQSSSLNVYPNPTTDRILFSEYAERADVWDENGKCVLSAKEVSSMDLSALANGVYTLRVVTLQGVSVKKIVKR